MRSFEVAKVRSVVAVLLALAGCTSELTPEEMAELDARGPYVDEANDDEVASTTLALTGVAASTGFVWANKPSEMNPYAPNAGFSFNSAGKENRITKLHDNGVGRYRVDMPGLTAPGNVQVTAYGSNRNRCNLRSAPTNSVSGVSFEVACYTHDGIAADNVFVAFFNNTGDTTNGVSMASVSTTGEVSQIANVLTATRRSTGSYRIFMPNTGWDGVPFATARSTNGSFCHPSFTGLHITEHDGIMQATDIRCFNVEGEPANVSFHFTQMRRQTFSKLQNANGLSASTNDNAPGSFYSSTGSLRVSHFDYIDPASLNVTFFDPRTVSQSTSLVAAFTTEPVSCKPAIWFPGSNFVTSVVCHDVSGAARKVRVGNAIFGVPAP